MEYVGNIVHSVQRGDDEIGRRFGCVAEDFECDACFVYAQFVEWGAGRWKK
jgi:hypothetical protein